MLRRDRFGEEVLGARLDGFDRRFDRPEAGHHHDARFRPGGANSGEARESVRIGKPQVEKNRVGPEALDCAEGFRQRGGAVGLGAALIEQLSKPESNRLLVVDDQDAQARKFGVGRTLDQG
jgi:hypothetical protein